MCEFLDCLGVGKCAAYGFHSGGIILVTALKRQPERFLGIAVGGYAIWTPEEMALFGESYLPEALKDLRFYQPVERGLEMKIREKMAQLRALDEASAEQRYGK